MAAAMTDHIQNNPFGRSTDGHRDDWPAMQIYKAVLVSYSSTCVDNGMWLHRRHVAATDRLG